MYGQNMPEMQQFEIKNELAIKNLIEIVKTPELAELLPNDILEEAKKSIALYAVITTKTFSKDMKVEAKEEKILF